MSFALIKAAIPLFIVALMAAGVNISPEFAMFVVTHLELFMAALAASGLLTPSMLAAIRYKNSAD